MAINFYRFRFPIIAISQLILLFLFVYAPKYDVNFFSIDTISYGHLSNQLYQGNWRAFFNLTWSGISPLIASVFQRFGFAVLPSLALTRILITWITLLFLSSKCLNSTHSNRFKYTLIFLFTILVFSISQSVSDPALLLGLLLFFNVLFYADFNLKTTFKFVIICIITGLSRPVGFYIVISGSLFYLLIHKFFIKHPENQIRNKYIFVGFIATLLATITWSFFLGKINNINPTLGKNGAYNLSSIGQLKGQIQYNSADKWTAIASTYKNHLEYNPERIIETNNRLIHQWRWLDISSNVGKELKPWPDKLDKSNISYFIQYYLSNFYVFLKDFIWWIVVVASVALNKKTHPNWLTFILVFAFYCNLLFISHIESRYLVPFIIIALFLICNEKNLNFTFFNKNQILIILLVLQFQSIIQISSYCLKGVLNQYPKQPYYMQQDIPQPTQYVSFETMRPAWLTVKNPNLVFLGTLKDSAQLRTITNKNIKLVTFQNDTARFQSILP